MRKTLLLLLIFSCLQIKAQCWKSIAAGNTYVVALKTDGTLWAWGDNGFGQFGNGTTTNSMIPIKIGVDNDWKEVALGWGYTVALKTDGTLWAWGDNDAGQLGDGTTISKNTPTQIGTATDWEKISVGTSHVVAIKTNGTLWTWGYNFYGQLGTASNISKNVPTQVGTATWKTISAGGNNTIAIKTDGTLWAWGDNSQKQLSDGSTNNQNIPLQIGMSTDWQTISAGGNYMVAIKTNGTLWAWGNNNSGQLGTGTTLQENTPKQIGTSTDWKTVDTGPSFAIAIKTDSSMWAWGNNTFGQFGNSTTASSLIPTQIGIANNWQLAAAADRYAVALKTDSSVWTWGNNSDGQLGSGSRLNNIIPLKIDCQSPLTIIISQINVSCAGDISGSASVTSVTGGTAPYSYLWSNGKTTSSITGLTAGTYTCTIKDATSLSITKSINIIQPTPITFNVFTEAVCNNNNKGNISITASGGTPPYQYAISPIFAYQNSSFFANLSQGNYTVIVKDTKGCINSNTAIINTNSTTAPIANAQTFNNGARVESLKADGINLQWFSTITGGSALNISTPLQTGKYYVSQTINGCESSRTEVNITIIRPPLNEQIPINGLLAYYPFNGNANDLSGNESNGVATDVNSTSDRFGINNSAYSFNGKTSNIEADVKNYPLKGGSRTIAGWFKADKPMNSTESDLCLLNYGNATDPDYWFKISFYNKGYLDIQFDSKTFSSQENYLNNQWTFFAMVFNDDTNTYSLYINNVLKLSGSADLYTRGFGNLFRIGKNKSNNYFEGSIDDIGIWDRVLTTQEISNLYNLTPQVTATITASTPTTCGGSVILTCKTSIGAANTYQWMRNGFLIPNATSSSYLAVLSGDYSAEASISSYKVISNIVTVARSETSPPVSTAQTFYNSATVADLQATGVNIKWYNSPVEGNPLPTSTLLQTGQYYATQTINACESTTRVAVTITVISDTEYTLIPDINFEKALIAKGIDSGTPDGKVLKSKISSVTDLFISGKSISNLFGIQDFTSLINLECDTNQLTSIDVSKNTALNYLSLGENQVTTLDVSKNIALTDLYFHNNQITNIDVSKNTALQMLYFTGNAIKNIDVSKNTALIHLNCSSNLLTVLDISKNIALTDLLCDHNQLTALDVSKNTLLNGLYCNSNQIASLDLSKNTSLVRLECDSNKLTSLDISKNPINGLNCSSNLLTTLDISKNITLNYFRCSSNPLLVSLNLKNGNNANFIKMDNNLKNNPNLTCIQVDNVAYANANWSIAKDNTASFNTLCEAFAIYTLIPDSNFEQKLINLGIDTDGLNGKVLTYNISTVKFLDLAKSSISDLTGIQDFISLTDLYCSQNSLTTLNVSKNTALTTLDCNSNRITSLDVSNNIALLNLSCYSNQLTALDVKVNTALTKLDSGSNKYTALDVSSNTALTFLGCNTSQLTSLDVSKNTALNLLDCRENKLTHLDVSKIATLTELYFQSNQLTNVDISKNKALEFLNCSKNQLTALDVSVNTALVGLYANSNQLTSLNLKNANNVKFAYLNLINNPNLSCIQVDDVAYFNKNWANAKDATATYNTNCIVEYVSLPDANFEQKLINLGIDTDGLNGKITTADVSSVTSLDLSNSNIKDLSGIENFTSLTYLDCSNNQLTNLDLTHNLLLEILNASSNQLTSLDLSKNSKITVVYVVSNPLVFLNLQNGNNKNMLILNVAGKKAGNILTTTFLGLNKLSCIKVDDVAFSNANWSKIKDPTTTYSTTCKNLGIEDNIFDKAFVYPNPTKGEVSINNITLEKATVYNVLGQLVRSFTLDSSNTNNTINLSGLPKGVYYVYLINQDAASAKKVIVE